MLDRKLSKHSDKQESIATFYIKPPTYINLGDDRISQQGQSEFATKPLNPAFKRITKQQTENQN
jgi:hypothetical protein